MILAKAEPGRCANCDALRVMPQSEKPAVAECQDVISEAEGGAHDNAPILHHIQRPFMALSGPSGADEICRLRAVKLPKNAVTSAAWVSSDFLRTWLYGSP